MQASAFVFIAVALVGAQGTCDPEIINKIKTSWNGNPPTNIIQKLTGKITWLTTPSYYSNYSDDISCAQTTVDSTGAAKDFVYLGDTNAPSETDYQLQENEKGILQWEDESSVLSNNMYVVYQTDNVLAYFQCQSTTSDSYEPYAGMAAVNIKDGDLDNSDALKADLQTGSEALNKLGLRPLEGLYTDCKF